MTIIMLSCAHQSEQRDDQPHPHGAAPLGWPKKKTFSFLVTVLVPIK